MLGSILLTSVFPFPLQSADLLPRKLLLTKSLWLVASIVVDVLTAKVAMGQRGRGVDNCTRASQD